MMWGPERKWRGMGRSEPDFTSDVQISMSNLEINLAHTSRVYIFRA